MFEGLTDCWIADEYEVHIVGAYHMDGAAHGATPGRPSRPPDNASP